MGKDDAFRNVVQYSVVCMRMQFARPF